MLVLSRQIDETVMIGNDIEVKIVDIRGDKVWLGIKAPKSVAVHRKEVWEAIKKENAAAANFSSFNLVTADAARRPTESRAQDEPGGAETAAARDGSG